MKQREFSLVLGSMEEAHYTTLKDGLCKAYLASCVIGSKLVSTSQTGLMGTVSASLGYLQLVNQTTNNCLLSRWIQYCLDSRIIVQLFFISLQIGKALKLIGAVTPVLGGLASVAAIALEYGDHHVQTHRVIKVKFC